MKNTRLRRTSSYTGEDLDSALKSALFHKKSGGTPLITVGTAQRLMGHIHEHWLSKEVCNALDDLQNRDAGDGEYEQFLAPVFRSIEDFRGDSVVANIHPDGNVPTHWATVNNPLLDETTRTIEIVINGVKYEGFDPRNPMIWPYSVYKAIKERKKPGRGNLDIVAGIVNTGIMLGGFSERPEIPRHLATATKRHFDIVGK